MDSLDALIARASTELELPIAVGFVPLGAEEVEHGWWARVGAEPEKYAADARTALAAALSAHYADARAQSRRRSFRVIGR